MDRPSDRLGEEANISGWFKLALALRDMRSLATKPTPLDKVRELVNGGMKLCQ